MDAIVTDRHENTTTFATQSTHSLWTFIQTVTEGLTWTSVTSLCRMVARQSPSLATAAMALAVIAAAIVAITAYPAAGSIVPKADDVNFAEPAKHGSDEQYAALGFDPAVLLRQRRAVNFPTPDIIFHSPTSIDTASAGVPGSGFNITFVPRSALSYTLLDFYLLTVGTSSGIVIARNVAVTNTSWEYVPPA